MRKRIHVLARAVIELDHQLLLAHCRGAWNTYLPGGHVEIGEGVTEALQRELAEEFGANCSIGFYLGAVEHTFEGKRGQQHEVNHIFRVDLQGFNRPIPIASLEDDLEFLWHPVASLAEARLEPSPLVELLGGRVPRPWWASTIDRNAHA